MSDACNLLNRIHVLWEFLCSCFLKKERRIHDKLMCMSKSVRVHSIQQSEMPHASWNKRSCSVERSSRLRLPPSHNASWQFGIPAVLYYWDRRYEEQTDVMGTEHFRLECGVNKEAILLCGAHSTKQHSSLVLRPSQRTISSSRQSLTILS